MLVEVRISYSQDAPLCLLKHYPITVKNKSDYPLGLWVKVKNLKIVLFFIFAFRKGHNKKKATFFTFCFTKVSNYDKELMGMFPLSCVSSHWKYLFKKGYFCLFFCMRRWNRTPSIQIFFL